MIAAIFTALLQLAFVLFMFQQGYKRGRRDQINWHCAPDATETAHRRWASGLVHTGGGWLGYGMMHGFGVVWLPRWWQQQIVGIWNPLVCLVRGHDTTLVGLVADPCCPQCSTQLKQNFADHPSPRKDHKR